MAMCPRTLDIYPGSELGKQGFVEEGQLPQVFLENDAETFGEEDTAHCGGLNGEWCSCRRLRYCLVDQRNRQVSSPYLTKTPIFLILTAGKSGLLA